MKLTKTAPKDYDSYYWVKRRDNRTLEVGSRTVVEEDKKERDIVIIDGHLYELDEIEYWSDSPVQIPEGCIGLLVPKSPVVN